MATTEQDWWAPIWSGLVLDPKHQKRMDRAIWVYLYLQTYADRKTGRLFRKYQAIADETGRSFNTIRRHMEKLLSLGYIEMNRKQYGFEIQITKWKPITTPKLVSEDGQCESNEPARLPNGGHSEIVQTAHSEVSDCPSVTSRLPTLGQSLNRRFKESKRNITKAVVETVSVDIEIGRFLNFARKSHQHICNCFLFDGGKGDREKVGAMLEQLPLKSLCLAWVLFMRTDDPFILDRYPSRNIAIFKAQLRNFAVPAERKVMECRDRRKERAKSSAPEIPVAPEQEENWNKCLKEIEAQILPENYSMLIKPLVFSGIKQGKGVILCPSKYYLDCVSDNYSDLIAAIMSTVFGKAIEPVLLLDTG